MVELNGAQVYSIQVVVSKIAARDDVQFCFLFAINYLFKIPSVVCVSGSDDFAPKNAIEMPWNGIQH